MPLLVLACKMCPKNIEGTMYAMLMSTINMGIKLYSYKRINAWSLMGSFVLNYHRSKCR